MPRTQPLASHAQRSSRRWLVAERRLAGRPLSWTAVDLPDTPRTLVAIRLGRQFRQRSRSRPFCRDDLPIRDTVGSDKVCLCKKVADNSYCRLVLSNRLTGCPCLELAMYLGRQRDDDLRDAELWQWRPF